ncbi:uncharacterized protein DUF2325 [Rhizobium subbaraonis]|uniref:Uncharacterized protein DUF2325 n=1 Tax=Rhizobium subbaraonis TaxID=908946 RepID=A0A285UJ74_9HYPH|nr:uncharacterized protein DUF2325 [Rhizobium subbaraonis]
MHSGRDGQREAALRAMITARDARIAALEKEVSSLKARLAAGSAAAGDGKALAARAPSSETRVQRPVEITRVKRRSIEIDRRAARQRQQADSAESQSDAAVKASLEGRNFLYVGGRDCQVAHLRQIASSFGANLIHHDGGLREAVSRIDNVLPSVDCVFCPIDCISHDACLRVKTGCKKWEKAFVPLRNGSKSSFERALQSLSEGTPVQ